MLAAALAVVMIVPQGEAQQNGAPTAQPAAAAAQPTDTESRAPGTSPTQQRDQGKTTVKPAQDPKKPRPPVVLEGPLGIALRLGLVPDLTSLGKDRPLQVLVLPDSPADKAGVRSGDQITALNGSAVARMEDVPEVWSQLSLNQASLEDGLRLSLLRQGNQVEVKLTRDLLQGFLGPTSKPIGGGLSEVAFTYRPQKPVEAVYLAGTFNDWQPKAHRMDGPDQESRYTTRLKLKAGVYEYKFVLDGQRWETDPENILMTGIYHNSVLHVSAQPQSRWPWMVLLNLLALFALVLVSIAIWRHGRKRSLPSGEKGSGVAWNANQGEQGGP
jgi:hypothetical protein